jgi:hypothetical protein
LGARVIYPELELWRSVLLLGLRDAARPATPQDARWPMTRDFVAVCHLAQMDPEAVRRAMARHPERFTGAASCGTRRAA